MPPPMSLDLRERIVRAVENGSSMRAAARRFAVSASDKLIIHRAAPRLAGRRFRHRPHERRVHLGPQHAKRIRAPAHDHGVVPGGAERAEERHVGGCCCSRLDALDGSCTGHPPPVCGAAETLTGTASAIDGGTFVIGSTLVGLAGVHAPELAQKGARQSWPRRATEGRHSFSRAVPMLLTVLPSRSAVARSIAACAASMTAIAR
jgi:hypothetical protein